MNKNWGYLLLFFCSSSASSTTSTAAPKYKHTKILSGTNKRPSLEEKQKHNDDACRTTILGFCRWMIDYLFNCTEPYVGTLKPFSW